MPGNDLAAAIRASAARLGADPVDLGTVISYETGGTFDPWKAGPTTQYGQHRGLIQWGEPQRAKYGVTQDMPVDGQMGAVERYLTDAGYKPGMGILDLYSAINAGRVGRYNASDANNGGAPGTVRDKVEQQMGAHREKAAALLGGGLTPVQTAAVAPNAPNPLPGMTSAAAMAGAPAAPMIAPVPDPAANLQAMFAQQQTADAQARAKLEEANQQRKKALFANLGSMFG